MVVSELAKRRTKSPKSGIINHAVSTSVLASFLSFGVILSAPAEARTTVSLIDRGSSYAYALINNTRYEYGTANFNKIKTILDKVRASSSNISTNSFYGESDSGIAMVQGINVLGNFASYKYVDGWQSSNGDPNEEHLIISNDITINDLDKIITDLNSGGSGSSDFTRSDNGDYVTLNPQISFSRKYNKKYCFSQN